MMTKFHGLKVLLSCHSLKGFTGSEMHSLQLGCYFTLQGAEVTYMAFECGEPMLSEMERIGFKVISRNELVVSRPTFDIVWSHHETAFLWLHVLLGIRARCHVHGILSWTQKIERIPLIPSCLQRDILRIFANSPETRDHAAQLSGRADILVMPNFVPEAFFEHPRLPLPPRPKNIAVVSNHVPDEILSMRAALNDDGVEVAIFGKDHVYTAIDHRTLVQFDVVVTIGKTVQYCMAQGIPVFVYDQFGGPGYLGTERFDEHAAQNFSGRSHPQRRSGNALAAELMDCFADAASQVDELRITYATRYAIDLCVEGVIGMLNEHAAAALSVEERIKTFLAHIINRPQPLVRMTSPKFYAVSTAVYDWACRLKS